MDITLDSSADNSGIIKELLNARGIGISDMAGVCFVPKGGELPAKGISVVYDPADIDGLIAFIDSFKTLSDGSFPQHVVGKKEDRFSILPVVRIIYFESMGNYLYAGTAADRLEVNKKLYEVEQEFAGAHFLRISKSYVINLRWIEEIWPWFGGRLMLKCRETGEKLEVSRNYVKSFKEKLGM